jgi:hypothetical protein
MRNAVVSAATIGIFLLGACASIYGPPKPTNVFIEAMAKTQCPSTCSVAITVAENSDGTCAIGDVQPIEATGANGSRKISWTIAASGYKFSDDAFKFALFVKTDPQGKFKDAKVKGGGKVLEVDFEHKKMEGEPKLIYDYALTVQRTNGSFCITKDPWVIS